MTITSSSVIKKLLILFLVIAALHYGKVFLMPLTVGGILATLFLPFSRWMEANKLPRGIAVLICMSALLLIVAGVGMLLGWQVSELVNDFSRITQKASEAINRTQEYIYNNFGISAEKQSQMLKMEQSSITGMLQKVAGSLVYIITNFILVMAYFFLLMYYRTHIRNFFLRLTPSPQQKEIEQVLGRITNVSQQYLLGLAKMIVCLWIMYGIAFTILGVKNALFFAILCGLLEIIPFIGNITGTTITVLVAASQGAGLPILAGIIGIYIVVQMIQEWILGPVILGPQVKINPFATILALIAGDLIWGIPGIFIAIPVVAMFKIVCDHIEQLKPFGFLIGKVGGKEHPGIVLRIRKHLMKKETGNLNT